MDCRKTMTQLNTALNLIDSAYAILAKKHGLTFNSLMMIYLMDELPDITQKQLCDGLHIPKSTVHSILLDFIQRGYVRLKAGDNKKEKQIAVTHDGTKYFTPILEETRGIEHTVLNALGNEACSFLTATAEKLGCLMMEEIQHLSQGGKPHEY